MDRQIKPEDDPLARIIKTIPAELLSLMTVVHAFLDNQYQFLIVGLAFLCVVPFYCRRVLKIGWDLQLLSICVNYLAYLVMVTDWNATTFLQDLFHISEYPTFFVKIVAVVAIAFQILGPPQIGPPS